jgi:DNA replication protein DnaC
MEPVGAVVEEMMEGKSLPSRTSPRSSFPEPEEKHCPDCGSRIRFVFVGYPFCLRTARKEPHWSEQPCESCEKKRIGEEDAEKRKELKQVRIEALLKNSMLKKRFIEKRFDNFLPFGKENEKQIRALTTAREFAENFPHHREIGTWLLFMGNVGTGKGHLCAAIINEVVRANFTALFTKAPRLLREVKETYNRNSEVTEREIHSRLEQIDLLIIDEVGVQFGTSTEQNIIFEILDARYEDMLPTILTTNIRDLKTLERLLGERIVDRFFEGESKIVPFDWESHRRFRRLPLVSSAGTQAERRGRAGKNN